MPLSRLQQAVLGVVWGHGPAGVSRSRLIWLLWEDDDDARARHRLSQLLYSLGRRAGGGSLFVGQANSVLPTRCVLSSLGELESLARDRRFRDAEAVVSAGWLVGLRGAISAEFENWRASKDLTFRNTLRDAAASAWADAELAADWRAARDAAEALLSIDPESETYLRCVMKARLLTGCPEEAEAAYSAWADRRGAGNSPGSLTTALRTLIEHQTNATGSSGSGSLESGDPPFIGRAVEVTKLREAVASQHVQIIVVRGPAGIGKSRLLHEISRIAMIEGLTVLKASCSALEQRIPLSPILDALSSPMAQSLLAAIDQRPRTSLQDLLAEPGERPNTPSSSDEYAVMQRRLFLILSSVFEAMARVRPIFFWIDDAQWADDTSVAALEFALRRWSSGRFAVCVTTREEVGQVCSAQRILDKIPERRVDLSLGDLGDADAHKLIRSFLPSGTPDDVVQRVVGLGAGNPLYLIELALDYKQGRLALPGNDRGSVSPPPSIQRIVRDRLAGLTERQHTILEALSVGVQLTRQQLGELTGDTEDAITGDLLPLTRLRLVRYEGGVLSISHDLLRHVLYTGLPRSHAALLHRRIAEMLRGREGEVRVGELAVHYDMAGDAADAFRFALTAADRAEASGALPEAVRFVRVARRHAATTLLSARLTAREGRILLQLGDLQAAVAVLPIAEDSLRREGLAAEALSCAILRLSASSELGVLDPSICAEQLNQLMREAEQLSQWDLFLRVVEAKMKVLERAGDATELRRTVRAIDRIPSNSPSEVLCAAHSLRALDVLFGGSSRWEPAWQALQLARETGIRHLIERTENRLFVVLVHAGRIDAPDSPYRLADYLELAKRTDDSSIKVNCFNSAAVWMLDTGNLAHAYQYLDRAVQIIGDGDVGELRARILANQSELALYDGQYAEGLGYARRALGMASTSGLLRIMAHATAGLCALRAGDLRSFRALSRDFLWDGDSYFECAVPTWFVLEIAKTHGDLSRGLAFLRDVSRSIEGRLNLTWLKLGLLEIENSWRIEPKLALKRATRSLELSRELGLRIRAEQFEQWVRRIARSSN